MEKNKKKGRQVTNLSIQTSNEKVGTGLTNLYAPSIFDWFVATLAISLPISSFIFPIYFFDPSLEKFSFQLGAIRILLLCFGFLLLSLDVFRPNSKIIHKSMHILLGSTFLGFSIIHAFSANYLLALGYSVITLILYVTTFVRVNEYLKFLTFINILMFLLGILALISPQSFNIPLIVDVLINNKIVLVIVWYILYCFVFISSIYSIWSSKWMPLLLSIGVTGGSLIFAVLAFSSGHWEKAICATILASFSVMFPFWRNFERFTLTSRKELFGSVVWLLSLFVIGIFVVSFMDRSFENYVLKELTNRVETASSITESFVLDNKLKVKTFSENDQLIDVMLENEKDEEKMHNLLKSYYFSSNFTFKRISLVDSEGKTLISYPENPLAVGVNVSDRDYFKESKTKGVVYLSGILQPKVATSPPSVPISAGIFSKKGEHLGLLVAPIDLQELEGKLYDLKFGDRGSFILVDNQNNFILHPNKELVLTKSKIDSASYLSQAGKFGTKKAFNSTGEYSFQAYKPVEKLNWGIVAQQPFSEGFKSYRLTSFIVFLILIICGTVTLLVIIYFKRKKDE